MIEILFIYQQVRNPVQATARRSVVPQPVSRHTRQAAMPRKHQFVKSGDSPPIMRWNQPALAKLGHAHPRLEIPK